MDIITEFMFGIQGGAFNNNVVVCVLVNTYFLCSKIVCYNIAEILQRCV